MYFCGKIFLRNFYFLNIFTDHFLFGFLSPILFPGSRDDYDKLFTRKHILYLIWLSDSCFWWDKVEGFLLSFYKILF